MHFGSCACPSCCQTRSRVPRVIWVHPSGLNTAPSSTDIPPTPLFFSSPCRPPESPSSSTPCTATSPNVRVPLPISAPPHVSPRSGRIRQNGTDGSRRIRSDLPVRPVPPVPPHPLTDTPTRRIPETLPDEVLAKLGAPPKPDYPVISAADLTEYDAYLFGIPTRYGNFPGQWKVRAGRPVRRQCLTVPAWAYRRSGTRQAGSGPRAPSRASLPACSSPRVPPAAARKRPS